MFKKIKLIHYIGLILLATTTALLPTAIKYYNRRVCLNSNGKWATNGEYCINQDCAKDSSCIPSYNNYDICKSLKIGISQNELYFHLGMPKVVENNNFIFLGGSDEPKINATIKNHTVVNLTCGKI